MSTPCENEPRPILVVLSGPSGVGKDAVLSRMVELGSPHYVVVTTTTRPIRPGEQDGVDYNFASKDDFQRMIEADELLEWAEVYGNYYGSPKAPIRERLKDGQNVILKIDVQGAANVRKQEPEALTIFLAPPSMAELERRLRERMTESPEGLALRLQTARQEMEEASRFDYTVVNRDGELVRTVQEIERIINEESRRTPPRKFLLA